MEANWWGGPITRFLLTGEVLADKDEVWGPKTANANYLVYTANGSPV